MLVLLACTAITLRSNGKEFHLAKGPQIMRPFYATTFPYDQIALAMSAAEFFCRDVGTGGHASVDLHAPCRIVQFGTRFGIDQAKPT
ncbi:hypothetical protein [Comamonas sp. BIGb0124]|uniref:hypothetical protein n=1 Tax=Comamonas sp. BIGb0124 TaxID=2485130 RepID=UPI0011CE9A26|nr:hypothetical protein [Comamonas sp. BIGb0124]